MLSHFVQKPTGALFSLVDRLSDREMEVLELIGNGYGTREIAALLNPSVKTIDSYREHLKDKLAFASGSDLVRFAIQWEKSEGICDSGSHPSEAKPPSVPPLGWMNRTRQDTRPTVHSPSDIVPYI
jgi:DNA-binding CsgD family transcriptional regulator